MVKAKRTGLRHGAPLLAACFSLLLGAPAQAALHWGDWQVTCTGYGEARYAARLWEIPVFASWEQTCQNMKTTLRGVTYSTPSRCINVGPGESMWGEFDRVPEPSCKPHWGDLRDDQCVPGAGFSGLRQYSAILWDVPAGVSWEDACSLTGVSLNGVWHPRPAVCVQSNFSWLGSIAAIIAGAAVGVVTVNPAAGAAAGVAISTVVLVSDAATGGFGAMNEWGIFYAVDPTCGPLAGGGGGGGGGGDGDDEALRELTAEAARCQKAIGRATGKLLTSTRQLHARCLDREARGAECDTAALDAKLERAAAKAERSLAKACSAGDLGELGFAGSRAEIVGELVSAASFEAESLIGETYPARTGALDREAARCQQTIGSTTGKVLAGTHRAHARCLASEAHGRDCDAGERDGAMDRLVDRANAQIAAACSADDLARVGFAGGAASGLAPAAVYHAEALILETHPMPFPSKP
jgi:hypothetical protein